MKLYIEPFRGAGLVDYTQSVVQDSLVIEDSINVPTVVNFTLVAAGNSFVLPQRSAWVKVVSEIYSETGGYLTHGQQPATQGKVLATGFVTNEPEREYLGLNKALSKFGFQQLTYRMNITSDEWLLNTNIVPFVPAFVNQTQGEILASLAEALAPGFFNVSSFVASGDIVPYFQYDPQRTWSDIAKTFADASRYRYKVINRTLYYEPFGDQALGVRYDETGREKSFFPLDLKTIVVTTPPVNDALVLGAEEPQDKFDNYVIGDGFSTNFKLRNQMFRGTSTLLLQDDWTENSFQNNLWTVFDPFGVFDLPGALNVIQQGQAGTLNQTYIVGKNGVELGGLLDVQTGEFQFVDTCEGIVGGIYVNTTLTQDNCIAGFRLTTPGGPPLTVSGFAQGVVIQPLLNGQLVGPQVVSQLNHHYQLETWFGGQNWARYQSAYRTLTGSAQYGGLTLESTVDITFVVRDIDLTLINAAQYQNFILTGGVGPPLSIVPVETKYTVRQVPIPSFGIYAPINSENLNLTLNFTQISQPPQGSLEVASLTGASGGMLPVLPPSKWTATTPEGQKLGPIIQYSLGFGLANPTATVTQTGDSTFLSFFDDTIPGVGARIRFVEWANGQAMSRVQNSIAIAQEAVVSGDTGVRSAIITNMQPQPRTSDECELAAAAAILDRSYPQFQGTYTIFTIPFRYDVALNPSVSDYPRSGRYFFINAPVRAISGQNFFVSTVRTQIVELREEILQVEVSYGPDLYLEKLLTKFIQRPEPNILGPSEQQVPPLPIQLEEAGSFYVPMFASAQVMNNADGSVCSNSLTGNFITINLNQVPVTAAEVRRVDSGWGQDDQNLIGLFTTQIFNLPRTSRDQVYYIRPRYGNKTSRFSYVARVNYPMIPSPPVFQSLTDSGQLVLALNGDVRDIYGLEIRLPGISGTFTIPVPVSTPPPVPTPVVYPIEQVNWFSRISRAPTDPFDYNVLANVTQSLASSGSVIDRPAILLNGWGSNGHVGAYEHGIDQNFNFFGLDPGTTNPYTNAVNATDGDPTTKATAIFQHTHQYAGCVWTFAAATNTPAFMLLNIDSEVLQDGQDGFIVNRRSAGIWYSLDSGLTWQQLYNQAHRTRRIDQIPLPAGQNPQFVQVMAFLDSHDDMAHYVYDISISVTPFPSNGYGRGDIVKMTCPSNASFAGLRVLTESGESQNNAVPPLFENNLFYFETGNPFPQQIGTEFSTTSIGTAQVQVRDLFANVISASVSGGIATVVTDHPHGMVAGDVVVLGAGFTSIPAGQHWPDDGAFFTGQWGISNVPDQVSIQFGVRPTDPQDWDVSTLVGVVARLQRAAAVVPISPGQPLTLSSNGVLFQRPVFAPADLIVDFTDPAIKDLLAVAEQIDFGSVPVDAYFFNLTWDYSEPLHLGDIKPVIKDLVVDPITLQASWTHVSGRPTGYRVEVSIPTTNSGGQVYNLFTVDHPNNLQALTSFQLTVPDFFARRQIKVTPFNALGDGQPITTIHDGAGSGGPNIAAYEIHAWSNCPIPPEMIMLRVPFDQTVIYQIDLFPSQAWIDIPPTTENLVFSIQKFTVTNPDVGVEFACLTYFPGNHVGVYTCPTGQTFQRGEVIKVIAPTIALDGVGTGITLSGTIVFPSGV